VGDYLDAWSEDWASRGRFNPALAPRAWELREQGWSHAEIAGRLGVSVAEAYQLVTMQRAYERTPDPTATIGHLMTTVNFNLSHAVQHTQAALDSKGAERQFNLEHIQKHLAEAAEHAHHLVEAVRQEYPEIGKEYDRITRDMGPYE
jgi:N-acetyl-beta-hexosaminidase